MTELMPSLCNDCVARNQCGNDDVKMCVSYIKEVKIKCDDCKFVEDCVDYGWDGCKKFTQKQPHTNEEWLRTATTEQLAEEVYKLVWCSNELFQQMECSGIDTKENDLKIVTEWLKQPHTTIKE